MEITEASKRSKGSGEKEPEGAGAQPFSSPRQGGEPMMGAGYLLGGAKTGEIDTLLQQANGSPAALRELLRGRPALLAAIGARAKQDPILEGLLAKAFPSAREKSSPPQAHEGKAGASGDTKEKDIGDPTIALPAARADSKKLKQGTMTWTLSPNDHTEARCDVDFKPDETKVQAKNVSFIQTVLNKVGSKRVYAGGSVADPTAGKAERLPYEGKGKKRVDHALTAENDPFYGAEWDSAAKQWKNEGGGTVVGSSDKGVTSSSAKMNDTPNSPLSREGLGKHEIQFETVPVVLETREPLGALKWGFKVKDTADAPIQLTGAEQKDCKDKPSSSWSSSLDKFYKAKFDTILDEFTADGFDLKSGHKKDLDDVAARLTADATLTVQLGGAADLKEATPQDLSEKRAQAAMDYLVAKGIDAARIKVEGYGSDWARVKTAEGKSEKKNRRVQVWVK